MAQPTQPSPDAALTTRDCIHATIVGFMVPFFLAGAGGNHRIAAAAVAEVIDSHHPATTTELDLVGRILGFSIAALDNLRLSAAPGLSDSKILRYRGNAVTLSRAAETARRMLQTIQSGQPLTRDPPRPTVAPAPQPAAPQPAAPQPTAPQPTAPQPTAASTAPDIEAMKRDARAMIAAFSRQGAQTQTAFPPQRPDTETMVRTATRAAIAAATRPAA